MPDTRNTALDEIWTDEPGQPEPVEVRCKRCRGTCEDRHGNDCTACDGMGSILL